MHTISRCSIVSSNAIRGDAKKNDATCAPMSREETINNFIASIPWKRYAGLRYAFVAYERDGVVQNLGSQLVFCPKPPPRGWAFQSTIGRLRVVRGWMATAAVRRALKPARQGRLVLGRTSLYLSKGDRPFQWNSARQLRRDQSQIDWAARNLTGSGPNVEDVLDGGFSEYEQLGRRLPAASPRPFPSWGALQAFLGPETHLAIRDSTAVGIYLPTYARIASADVALTTGVVTVRIECHEMTNDASLVLAPELVAITPLCRPARQWHPDGQGFFHVSATLAPDVGPVRVQLVMRGEVIDETVTGSPPLAVRAHAALDDGCEWIRRLLGLTDRKKVASDGFEVGVAALLNLAGIPAIHYGHKSGDHFPDILCTLDDHLLIVAECTVDSPSLTKVQTLAARAGGLRARADSETKLVRILFTPKALAEISDDVKRAAEEQLSVAILGRERIAELLDDVVRGETQWKICFKLLSWVSRYGSVTL